MLWNKSFGKEFDDEAFCMITDNEGKIYVGGRMNALGDSIMGKSWILKLDANGSVIWSRNLKGTIIKSLAVTSRNELIAGGTIYDTTYNCQLFKLNSDGEEIWKRIFITGGKINQVKVLSDDKIVFSGGKWLALYSNEGYLLIDKFFESKENIKFDTYNNSILVGYIDNEASLNLEKYDLELNAEWTKKYNDFNNQSIGNIILKDAILLLGQNEEVFSINEYAINGDVVKNETIQKNNVKKPSKLDFIDGNIIIGGTCVNFNQKDMFILKMAK